MTEASKLAAFLLALQTSDSVQRRFRRNKKKEMQRFDLEPATIEAVLVEDTDTLWYILSVRTHLVAVTTGVPGRRRRRKRKEPPHQIAMVTGVARRRRKEKPRGEHIAVATGVEKPRRKRKAKHA